MKINYFELKVVDSRRNLPELKHSSKRQTNAYPHINQAAFPPMASQCSDLFFATSHTAQCGRLWAVNRKQMGRLAEDRHKKHKN